MAISTLSILLHKHFSRGELIDLYYQLGLDYEDARSLSKRDDLIPELIKTCQEKNKLGGLLQICNEKRSFVDWPALEEIAIVEDVDLLIHPHLPVYKAWVVQQYNVMRLLSMKRQLPLEAVYTDVYLLNKRQYLKNESDDQTTVKLSTVSRHKRGIKDRYPLGAKMIDDEESINLLEEVRRARRRKKELKGRRFSALEVLVKEKHLFIVGEPGTGKTTFLKWLAVNSARNKINLDKIPILIELRRFNDEQNSLFDLIVQEWLDSGFPKSTVEDYVEQLIRSGETIILLDGLDEVRQELRERINNQIEQLVKMSGESNLVITCRPHAEKRQFKTFAYMQMAEFTSEQVDYFVNNWFGDEKEKAITLNQELATIEQKPTKELTTVPLLLALICITYHREGMLPQKRAELYRQALNVVLSEWDDTRGIRRESVYGQLDIVRKEELLAYIAFHSFEAEQFFIPKKELEKLIQNYWQGWRHAEIGRQKEEYGQIVSSELPERNVNAFKIIIEIITQHGIFVEQAKDVYSFAHLSFQEYFVARFVVENEANETVNNIAVHLTDDYWREVFFMTVSMLDDADLFFKIMIKSLNQLILIQTKLTDFFHWANSKVINEQKDIWEISSGSLLYLSRARTLAFALDWDLGRNNDNSLTLDITSSAEGIANNLELSLNRDLALVRALELDPDYIREFTFGYHRYRSLGYDLVHAREIALDRDLDFANSIDHDIKLSPALALDHILALTLARIYDLGHDRDINRTFSRDRAFALDREHVFALCRELGLSELKKRLMELSLPKETFLPELWKDLYYGLQKIMQEYRNIAWDWDFTKEEANILADYFAGTKLIYECLELANVSDWEGIEKRLLLPE